MTGGPTLPRLLRASTLARLLDLDRRVVYRLCRSGVWPGAVRVDGHRSWRVPELDVIAWLRRQAAGR